MTFLRLWNRITGNNLVEFSFENKVFNSVSIITLILLIILLPFNYMIGLHSIAILICIGIVIQYILFHLARFKKKFRLSIVIYAVASYVMLAINYYYNSGSKGPTIFLVILSLNLLITLTNRKSYWIWICTHLLMVTLLLTVEYFNPNWIPYTYKDEKARYIDLTSAYVMVVLVICFCTYYLRRSFDKERELAEQRAQSIEIQNRQLEKLVAEKEKLFSIVSHDIRSPLASIQSYLELLIDYKLEEDERMKLKGELLDLTKSTSDMLTNLLSWSKARMFGATIQTVRMNPGELVKEILPVLEKIARKKNIEMRYSLDPFLYVSADPGMIQLVIRNMINNAIKFTRHGGMIEISSQRNESGKGVIHVRDNGIGISPEQQKELFTPKSRSTFGTENEQGIGLGLILCKEFIEMQNGTIDFESKEGQGSDFFITLPFSA